MPRVSTDLLCLAYYLIRETSLVCWQVYFLHPIDGRSTYPPFGQQRTLRHPKSHKPSKELGWAFVVRDEVYMG